MEFLKQIEDVVIIFIVLGIDVEIPKFEECLK